jgi:hypothetical protein
MKKARLIMTAILLVVAATVDASTAATIWTPCQGRYWAPNGVSNRVIVNVYLDPTLSGYLGITQSTVELAVTEATSIWNEQSGSALAFRWMGSPPTGANIPNLHAIYVTHSPTNACGGGTQMATYGMASNGSSGAWQHAEIEVRKYSDSNGIQCTNQIGWKFYAENDIGVGRDFVSDLLHELGHASFVNDLHPLVGTCPSTSPSLTSSVDQQSIMDRDGVNHAGRVLRAWDKHRAANIYGHREQYSSLQYRTFNSATNTWAGVQTAIAAPSHIEHMVAASQNAGSIIFEWDERGTVNYGSRKNRWFGSLIANSAETLNTTFRFEAPGAIAFDTINNRTIAVYQHGTVNQYGLNGDSYPVFYRLSTNGGATFGPEISTSIYSRRYGIGAGFDPVTSKFIISYSADPSNVLYFVTLPSAGGNLTFTSYANVSAWEGASIACRNAVAGCRMVYRDINYNLRMLTSTVNTDGTVSLVTNSQLGYYVFGRASVAWSIAEQQFHIAFRGGFGAIYGFKLAATGTTIIGTGDITNNNGINVSSPTMATTTLVTYSWYVQWW